MKNFNKMELFSGEKKNFMNNFYYKRFYAEKLLFFEIKKLFIENLQKKQIRLFI